MIIRPDQTLDTGTWSSTGSDLHSVLDEVSPSDGDYIYQGVNFSVIGVPCSIEFNEPAGSFVSGVVRLRSQIESGATSPSIALQLWTNGSLVHSYDITPSVSFATHNETITSTIWNDCTLFIDASALQASIKEIRISWIEIELFEATGRSLLLGVYR